MAKATTLAALMGTDLIDQALGMAATAGRFADGDLASIAEHLSAGRAAVEVVRADEAHSVQPGTRGWEALGR